MRTYLTPRAKWRYPPTSEYVNLHTYCFHLHQIPNDGAHGND